MSAQPGTLQTLQDIQSGFDRKNAELIFGPQYNFQTPNLYFVPSSNQCQSDFTVDYNVDFAVAATDSGSVQRIVDALGQLIKANPAGLTPATAIDVVDQAFNTLSVIRNQTNVNSEQHFYLNVNPCCDKKNQKYDVTVTIDTSWLVNDTGGANDFAQLTYTIMAPSTPTITKTYALVGKSAANNGILYPSLIVESFSVNITGPFKLYIEFKEHCHVVWSPALTGLGNAWVACIKFNHIRIEIKTGDECADVEHTKIVPLPPTTPPPKKER